MAVVNSKSAQRADEYRGRPTEDHGKIRFAYFRAVTVASDAGGIIELVKLPPGAVRVLPGLSRYSIEALGAARTLDFGHLAYTKKGDGTEEAADPDAFVANIDVSGAVAGAALDTDIKFDFYSTGGVILTAQVNDAAIPADKVLEGYFAYVYE